LDEESDVGHPYEGRDGYYSPILIPNSDSGGLNKFWKSCLRSIELTHEARSSAKRQRRPGKIRSGKEGNKNEVESTVGVFRLLTNCIPIKILGII
jgi:hypothetical protein